MKLKSLEDFQNENQKSKLEANTLAFLKGGVAHTTEDEDYCTNGGSDCYTITYSDGGDIINIGAPVNQEFEC